MKNSRFTTLTLLALTLCGAASAAPVHVSVETMMGTQEHGAGISVGKGLECFVVTPAHVVHMGQTITITDRNGNTATATNFQEAPEEIDAILLKVEQDHRLDCPEDWDTGSDAEAILYDVDFLVSRKVKAGGCDDV